MNKRSKIIGKIISYWILFSIVWTLWTIFFQEEKPACVNNACGPSYIEKHGYCPRVRICYENGETKKYPY